MHRENLLNVLRRKDFKYIPYNLMLCNKLKKDLEDEKGVVDYVGYFNLPVEFIGISPTKKKQDYSKYYEDKTKYSFEDEWGVRHMLGSIEHFTRMIHPLKEANTIDEIKSYPFPDTLADYRWEQMNQSVKNIHKSDRTSVFGGIQIFETAWYLRGLEQLLVDMYSDSEIAIELLKRVTSQQVEFSKKAAATGVDIIVFGDDVGSQKGMMISPQMWREWLKPTMEAAIKAAKQINPNVLAYYHSDGDVYEIIEDLIEIGVDILNPVQPECMDPIQVKEEFGDRISLWGTIGTQTTMPFGNKSDVENVVRDMINNVGYNGGLLIAPSHLLEPEVPLDNIFAFIKSVKEFGGYNEL